jgi:short-subunit dehydrogenase
MKIMCDQYALITGASEGLGKFLAIKCAKIKMNLVLVALPGSGLKNLQNYIIKTFQVDVLCIELDLSEEENCYQLYRQVKEENIVVSVLINNAGIGGTFPFGEKDALYYSKVISLNVITPTILCRLFLPDLKKNTPSFIMNVSSLAGIFHLPNKQVYGATKSYLLSFSKSLRRELMGDNISVSVLCPGGMNTYWRLTMENRMMGTWISRKSVMEPSVVAAIGIRKMFQKKELIIAGFWNWCFLFWNQIFPKRIKDGLMNYQMAKWKPKKIAVPEMQPQFVTVPKAP